MKQVIIAVGREFGSGGHILAEKLAKHYGIALYNKSMLEEMAKEGNYSKAFLEKFDEKPISLSFAPVHMTGGAVSIEQDVALRQFEFLRRKANEENESFVVIGRCADEILAGNPNLVSVFVLGDEESKIARVMDREGLTRAEAIGKMRKMDKTRKTYHNFYCEGKWGDSRSYDICVKSGNVDMDALANIVIAYIDARI